MDDLNIIFPVYNERDTLETVLVEWANELKDCHLKHHLVICEDGSKDGTKELLLKIKNKYNLVLNQKNQRRGYAGAVTDGIKSADSNYILCVDSDGQCDPKDFKKFWGNKDKADVLIGWRTNRADNEQRKLFSSLFKKVFKILFPTNIHDPSAPFVLFKKNTILPNTSYLTYLKEGFWWGFVGMCVKKGLSIKEFPINHRQRLKGDTQVYKPKEIPRIAITNLLGLIRLRLKKIEVSSH